MDSETKQIVSWIGGVVGGIIGLVILFSTFGTVSTGEVGVRTTLGKVTGVSTPGLYFKIPFVQGIAFIDVQTQKEQVDANAASNDLQTVQAKVAVNYNIDPNKVIDLFSKVGEEYKGRIIDPAIQEVVKAVTAQYTAEQLITKRAEVTDKIQVALADKLLANDINVTSVSITNFDFSQSFNDAIERKVTAEQNALAAKNKLAQVQFEAEQTVATAKATAEAQRISSAALAAQGGTDYVNLKWIEKWNGELPQQYVPGSAFPFLNLK